MEPSIISFCSTSFRHFLSVETYFSMKVNRKISPLLFDKENHDLRCFWFKLQSEKRKQELLAEMVFEEQRGRELSKIVNELVPSKEDNPIQNPSRARKVLVTILLLVLTMISL